LPNTISCKLFVYSYIYVVNNYKHLFTLSPAAESGRAVQEQLAFCAISVNLDIDKVGS